MPWTTAATTPGRLRRPGVVAAVVQGKAGKAGKTGPGQTKPRQGTTSKPAKPRQAFWLAGWQRFLAQTLEKT